MQTHDLQLRYWAHLAEFLIESEIEIHPPPTTWDFVTPLQAQMSMARKDGAKINLSEHEAGHYRSFQIWYQKVTRDLWNVCEMLGGLRYYRAPQELQDRAIDLAYRLHDGYRAYLDAGRIEWLPEQFDWKHRDGTRDRLTILEMLKRSIAHADGYPSAVKARGAA